MRIQNLIISCLLAGLALLLVGCEAVLPNGETGAPDIQTWLLVGPPQTPLALNQPVDIKSRTVTRAGHISHVELYAVEAPSGQTDILIRSDTPPDVMQTTFTASQLFVPTQPGYYVVKVIGYNTRGQAIESQYIGFEVE